MNEFFCTTNFFATKHAHDILYVGLIKQSRLNLSVPHPSVFFEMKLASQYDVGASYS